MVGEIVAVTNLFKFRVHPAYLAEVGYPEPTLQWWPEGQDPSAAIWVLLTLPIIIALNSLPARVYGEIEYIFSCIKMMSIVAIIMINAILNARQRYHDSRFWAWIPPYGFASANMTIRLATDTQPAVVYSGSLGNFAAFWTGLTATFFSMMGWDVTFITAPENKALDRTETVKLSGRKIALRVVVLYVLSVGMASLNVPYNDEPLRNLATYDMGRAETSIFVLAAIREHVPMLPHILVGFFVFSAVATASNCLYTSSRLIFSIAGIDEAWPWFLRGLQARLQRTRWGVPHRAVLASGFFGLLAFISLGPTASSSQVLALVLRRLLFAENLTDLHGRHSAASLRLGPRRF